ncbi:hypothetical protein CSKR_109732 [Clonorchis sinensis]|uniref:Uncharacterized protein n=1 Tax=Clonorchis sinensis TaxID=79923 RepID=A0A3R7GRL3_CLOSI|nr:hypothetical protein CSKR_109732 [Clonorchis sinensis]
MPPAATLLILGTLGEVNSVLRSNKSLHHRVAQTSSDEIHSSANQFGFARDSPGTYLNDVFRQLNMLHQAASCFSWYGIRDITIYLQMKYTTHKVAENSSTSSRPGDSAGFHLKEKIASTFINLVKCTETQDQPRDGQGRLLKVYNVEYNKKLTFKQYLDFPHKVVSGKDVCALLSWLISRLDKLMGRTLGGLQKPYCLSSCWRKPCQSGIGRRHRSRL